MRRSVPRKVSFAGRRLLITAGPTREMLDPVRFLSNVSTGEMGYALAAEAVRKGYAVTLISGPTALKPPKGTTFIPIVSAADLKQACDRVFSRNDILVMVAAVCDFTFPNRNPHKIRRTRVRHIRLEQTPDIVAGLAARKGKRKVIGFCLETEKWLENASAKLVRKNLDGIVANYYSARHIPFGCRRINTAFLSAAGIVRLHRKSKRQVASQLLAWIEGMVKKNISET